MLRLNWLPFFLRASISDLWVLRLIGVRVLVWVNFLQVLDLSKIGLLFRWLLLWRFLKWIWVLVFLTKIILKWLLEIFRILNRLLLQMALIICQEHRLFKLLVFSEVIQIRVDLLLALIFWDLIVTLFDLIVLFFNLIVYFWMMINYLIFK